MGENAHSPISLLIVISVAFLMPILLQRLRWTMIPFVVAEILAGMIIGKSGFNIVQEDNWLSILSLLGLIFLMFLSGLEIDFDTFSQKKKEGGNPFAIASFAFLLIFGASYLVSLVLNGLGIIEQTFFMTLIISTISLGVVVPVLKERRLTETLLGQVILLIAVISDFMTMILLAVFISLRSQDSTKPLLLLALFAVTFVLYRIIRRVRKLSSFEQLSTGTVQIGTRGVFLLIILFVALAENMGAENIIGAFLAGVIVSMLGPRKQFVRQLDAFGYGFLIPIFFVMVGVKLDLWALIRDPKVYIFIPLLLAALYVSKVIPLLILKKWFNWRETIGAGMLLTSTLSLVIAAAALALEENLIVQSLHDGLILVAILSCFISPVAFNRLVPAKTADRTIRVGIVGLNTITMPVALEVQQAGFDVEVYTQRRQIKENKDVIENSQTFYNKFKAVHIVDDFSEDTLTEEGLFERDVLAFVSNDDDTNMRLARHAQELGKKTIIVRMENPTRHDEVQKNGFILFSTLFSASALLKAQIEAPNAIDLIARTEDAIQTIIMGNRYYHETQLKQLPFLGDALILRIYRNNDSIIPHGDTRLQLGDRLLVTGSLESLASLENELS
ncbi:monovalent cation:proton antiporter family protein [Aneurinibacillus thermoaerophilus]|uniref:monovalent cation:proton antiporter family protein n=1 Tax=Aneurinibacillus thermoaerophilus TaxID=143495 RepID=UPI002E1D0AA5|nr:monovalent cation:proton antiporter family protein [Aneurinibacillus thermoaerophilus]